MRKFAIGDIRGDLTLFKKMIDKIGPTSSDVVVFLGSYLGPGEDSKGCIEYAIELRKKMPGTFLFLKGCYEIMFGRCIETMPSPDTLKLWESMKGQRVLESYAQQEALRTVGTSGVIKTLNIPMRVPMTHLQFIEKELQQWFEDDLFPYVLTHAGFHPSISLGLNEDEVGFAVRDFWKDPAIQIPGKTLVFSHVVFPKPYFAPGKLGIDLGAGFGGKLCAFEMVSQSFTIVER
jgi:serine/threonine protein phosphatase 1